MWSVWMWVCLRTEVLLVEHGGKLGLVRRAVLLHLLAHALEVGVALTELAGFRCRMKRRTRRADPGEALDERVVVLPDGAG